MAQEEISYEELKNKAIEGLKKHSTGTLATSEDGYVTARVLGILADGLKMYSFVGSETRKCRQISANPQVAVAAGNIQIEGIASLRGQPLIESNAHIIDLFKKTFPQIYENFSRKYFSRNGGAGQVIIEIISHRVTLFSSESNSLEILNIDKSTAHRVSTFDLENSPAYNE